MSSPPGLHVGRGHTEGKAGAGELVACRVAGEHADSAVSGREASIHVESRLLTGGRTSCRRLKRNIAKAEFAFSVPTPHLDALSSGV